MSLPCRVSADLSRKQSEEVSTEPFDEFNDDQMHDVMGGPRFSVPAQALLISLHQIEAYRGSFGIDKAKAFDMLLPQLQAFREACKDEWRNHK